MPRAICHYRREIGVGKHIDTLVCCGVVLSNRIWLTVLLLGTFLLSSIWAVILPTKPLGYQPDEGSHIAVIRFMASHHGAMPPYQMGYDTSIHPPLYHEIAALLYSIVSPSVGPNTGVIVVRLLSALISTGGIYATYLLARQTRLGRIVALPVATLAALIPMRLSLGGGASNENLAALGATASLLFLYMGIRRGFTNRRLFFLCFWTTLAIGSKVTCLGLLPAIVLGVVFARRPDQSLLRAGVIALAPAVAVLLTLGWWFAYNTIVYGDPLRKGAADRLWEGLQPGFVGVSERTGMSAWRYLVYILSGGWFSFWGQFNAMQIRFPLGIYLVFFVVQLVSFWGLGTKLCRLFSLSQRQIAMAVATVIFTICVLVIYIQYNWLHYTPQGRYFFVLLGPLCVFFVGGIHLFFRRYIPKQQTQRLLWGLMGALLIGLNVYTLWVMPTKQPVYLSNEPMTKWFTLFVHDKN